MLLECRGSRIVIHGFHAQVIDVNKADKFRGIILYNRTEPWILKMFDILFCQPFNILPKDDTGFREYKVKLCKVRDRILTDEGRRLASERHDFMERFFKRFINEYEGKR